jgi:hypothetical protein
LNEPDCGIAWRHWPGTIGSAPKIRKKALCSLKKITEYKEEV